MRILIDGDGCPVVDLTIKISRKFNIEVIIMCDTSHIFNKDGAKTMVFPKGADSVDFALINIIKKDDIIKIYVSGDGFLYNMVRIIVGTLLEVGKNKIKPEDVKSILDSKDRRNAGPCVPPNGLVLEKVFYSEEEYSYL